MDPEFYLAEIRGEFRNLKKYVDRALAQVSDDDFFATLDPESNSIAVIIKHMAGNMRSRWTDFLTSDGEKPDRHRDGEFIIDKSDSRASIMRHWEDGWRILFAAIDPLTAADIGRTITIRGQEHTIPRALHRQLVHYSMHIGQIALLAKHYAGDQWQTLSIPRGKSEEFTRSLRST